MKKKTRIKRIALLLMAALLFSTMSTAFAAGDETITFKGTAEKFVSDVQKDSEGFTGMLPGEERTVTLTLVNQDSSEMKFYMSAEIIDNIAGKTADSQAVYDFVISKNGTPFFSTIIGGGTTQNNSIGSEYLDKDNNILLDTLAQGQSDVIDITLKLDGSSTGNSYMNQTGDIQLVFTASTPDPAQGGNIIDQIVQGVTNIVSGGSSQGGTGVAGPNTGLGGSSTYLIIAALCIIVAIAAIVVLIVSRKKKGED